MRTCMVPGCDRPHMAKDFCDAHYKRWRAGQRGSKLNRRVTYQNPPELWTCQCTTPVPNGIGECAGCRRLVVNYKEMT